MQQFHQADTAVSFTSNTGTAAIGHIRHRRISPAARAVSQDHRVISATILKARLNRQFGSVEALVEIEIELLPTCKRIIRTIRTDAPVKARDGEMKLRDRLVRSAVVLAARTTRAKQWLDAYAA